MKYYGSLYGRKIINLIVICITFLSFDINLYAKSESPSSDTLIVDFFERRIGRLEITIIKRDKDIYLPIIDIFNFLRIKIDINDRKNTVEGFIITPDSSFEIDLTKNVGKYLKRTVDFSQKDYFFYKNNLYFHENILQQLFGWNIKFDENNVEVVFKSKLDLPIIKQRQREKAWKRRFEREQITSDFYIGRSALLFNLGKLNYNINVYKYQDRDISGRYMFKLGGQILGGDLDASVRGVATKKIKERDLHGSLVYPFFGTRLIGQITLGDIIKRNYVGGQLFGIDITNTPPERRTIFTTYKISRQLEASSEYYISGGGLLPSYIYTQRDTVITKQFPLHYGINEYIERKYNYYGIESRSIRYLVIPYSMLPPGEFDYRISAGRLRITDYPIYSSVDLNYGATQHISLGAGLEYVDRKNLTSKFYPYTYSTFRIFENFYGVAEFSPFVLSQLNFNWQTYDQKILNIRGSLYGKNKTLNPRNIRNSVGLGFQLPIFTNFNSNYINGYFDRNNLQNGNEEGIKFSLNSSFEKFAFGYSFFRYTTQTSYKYLIQSEEDEDEFIEAERLIKNRYIESRLNISTSPTLFSNLSLGASFDHVLNKLSTTQIGITISLFSNFSVNLIAEKNFTTNDIFALLSLSFNPKFFNSNVALMKGNFGTTYSGRISGEILGSTQTFDVLFNRTTQSKRGYFLTSAFLDLNNNGKKDENENYLENVRFTARSNFGYGIPYSRKYSDHKYLLVGEKYRDYTFNLKIQDLEDPMWVPFYDGITVKAEPNKLKRIEIPVVSGGIVTGTVLDNMGNPFGGILVNLYRGGKIIRSVYTNSRGEFEFSTIPSGIFSVSIDEKTLVDNNLVSEPAKQEIEVSQEAGKEYITVNFIVRSK